MDKLLAMVFTFSVIRLCSSADTIDFNESLADGDNGGVLLVSNGGTYTLGFFNPGNSRNRYVGIWYTKVPVRTVVWVANRDSPINDTSGLIYFDGRGDIVLMQRSSNATVWSTNVSASGKSTTARLLDVGNLVLLRRDGFVTSGEINQCDGKEIIWQSFDHPTDTIFPFMKFGTNYKTGLNSSLYSWKSLDDPGRGDFSYYMDRDVIPQLTLYKGHTKIWRTGPWNGVRWSGIPNDHFIFNNTVVSNDVESTFMWGITCPTIIARILVDTSGLLIQSVWRDKENHWEVLSSHPMSLCGQYGHCGPNGNCDRYKNPGGFECACLPGFVPKYENEWSVNDGSGGCVRRKRGNSSTDICGDGEGFVKVENLKVPDTRSGIRLNSSINLDSCRAECLKNCSCSSYASANLTSGIGCITIYGDMLDTRVIGNGGQDLYVRVNAIELGEYMKRLKGHTKKKKILVIVLASTGVAFILATSIVYWLLKIKRNGDNDLTNDIDQVTVFRESDILTATENFSVENKLGQGGFGSVYKGLLLDGQDIAVKKLSQTSKQGIDEFKNEVKLMSKLQHKNLARLLGCCIHGDEKMLVYEYLPNKSLDLFIFDKENELVLDWRTRFDIIIGIARGLLYLHQDSRLKIIHRDMKASNVLLDATMNPKIYDFGMARLFGEDQTEANTNRVVGTYGYMSPEYAMEGLYSTKSDVFSFGVLVLETVTGRRSNHCYEEDRSITLIGHVWELWKEGRVIDIVDSSSTRETYSEDQAIRCIHIGLLCVQKSPKDRPTMSNVVFKLGNKTALSSPKKPAFVLQKKHHDSQSLHATTSTTSSINCMSTTTIVEGR